jgi:toxin ParE1/3/4
MARYELTTQALEDLSDIWKYTTENWLANQADKNYQLLVESFREIASHPNIGRSYTEILDGMKGLNEGRLVVFFRSVNKLKIEIIRILHEQVDLRNRIEDK